MLETPKALGANDAKSLEDVTMGNQQRIIPSAEISIGYLVGIIDGEGTISYRVYKRKNGNLRASAFVQITNTCETLIQECHEILKSYQIGHHISSSRRTKRQKRVFCLNIQGIKRSYKFLSLFRHYLIAKRKQAEIMYEILQRRIELMKANTPNCKMYYTEQDMEDIKKIGILNRRGDGTLNDRKPSSELLMELYNQRRYDLNLREIRKKALETMPRQEKVFVRGWQDKNGKKVPDHYRSNQWFFTRPDLVSRPN